MFKRLIAFYGDDALVLAGCACFLYGLWQFQPILAWLIGGLMLIAFGVLLGREKAKANHVN